MASIFKNKDQLRSQLEELTAGDITGTTELTAPRLAVLDNETTVFSLYNGTNARIYLLAQNPKDTLERKHLWNVLEPGQSFNLDAVSGRMLNFPAETRIYVHTNGAGAASGTVRLFVW